MNFKNYIENELKLDYIKFIYFLRDNRVLLTGSAALYFYLLQEKIQPNFKHNDIDIFIASRRISDYRNQFDIFSEFEIENKIQEENQLDLEYKYYDNNKIIFVENYIRTSDNKKIQFIFCNASDIKQYIKDEFDFTVCMTWYDAKKNKFETVHKDTKNMISYINKNKKNINKNRLNKYLSRGFNIIDTSIYKILCDDNRLYTDIISIVLRFI